MSLLTLAPHAPAAFIPLGPIGLALDQPRVAVEVADTSGVTPTSLGPASFNNFLLDTGATSILAGGNPFTPDFSATGELLDAGLVNEGTVEERGVAGTTTFDVSAPYRFDFAGSDGARLSLPDTRFLSNDRVSLGFDGIVGTPAMVNRVTTFDMTVWSGGAIAFMGVGFSDQDPSPNDNRYSMPVELVRFDESTAPDALDGPAPTSGPLPFITVGVSNGGAQSTGRFVFDSGAQLAAIRTEMGLAIGLDTSGDGVLDAADDGYAGDITFGSVGGEVDAPLFDIPQIHFPTDQGVDLVYGGAQLAILDIDPAIDGIIGSDWLTAGWLDTLFGGPDGVIQRAHLDLRNPDTLAGQLLIDLNPALNTPVPEPTTALVAIAGMVFLFRRPRTTSVDP